MYCKRLLVLAVLIGAFFLSACDVDNYEQPESTLRGAVVYQGEHLGVRQNAIDFQIRQTGYEGRGFLALNVHQDGTFSAKLFDGEYQITQQGNGPWVTTTDSVVVQMEGGDTNIMRGDAEIAAGDSLLISVTPFFALSDVDIAMNDTTVTAAFNVEQVVEDASLQQVGLYVNGTQFVGAIGAGTFNFDTQNGTIPNPAVRQGGEVDDLDNIELSFPLTEEQRSGQSTVYARVGVFAFEAPEALYSRVVALDLPNDE